jgi:16S rRNA (adenine1518-N6/adenine1519-N6)-dimethyltransferase
LKIPDFGGIFIASEVRVVSGFSSLGQLPDYNSVPALKSLLESSGFAMQKKFGQNFLINPAARQLLIRAVAETGAPANGGTTDSKNSSVWEVGPGLGAMTSELLALGCHLTAFEIDHGFCALLRVIFAHEIADGQFTLIEGDVLKTLPQVVKQGGLPDCLFGNLPYNIAATLIGNTIEEGFLFPRAVFTVQKEMAERMTASPGTKDYSAFSVLCKWMYDVKKLAVFPGSYFWPQPDVDSQAVLMTPLAEREDSSRLSSENSKAFISIVHASFSSRRKTLKNNLIPFCGGAENAGLLLQKSGIDGNSRAEQLSVQDFMRLSQCLN